MEQVTDSDFDEELQLALALSLSSELSSIPNVEPKELVVEGKFLDIFIITA